MYDVAIIGAGIIGCACAYTLSKYDLDIVMLEKENDVCLGATRANSAIIHAGFDPEPNTLTGTLNAKGNIMCRELSRKLSVKFEDVGSFVTAFDEEEEETLKVLLQRGIDRALPGIKIISGDEAREMEPNLSKDVKSVLYAPSAAIINPWEFGIAMAQVACVNGTSIKFDFEVTGIQKNKNGYTVISGDDRIEAKYVINCAGVYADKIASFVSVPDYKIIPTAGEYFLLDKCEGKRVGTVIFPCPSEKGKGILVSPTVHGNLIVGPNANKVEEPDDTATTQQGMNEVRMNALKNVPSIDFRQNIRNFTGVRANSTNSDFIIEFAAENFLSLAGIRSPGLSASPAIAEYACNMLKEAGLELKEKDKYEDSRSIVHFRDLPEEEKMKIVEKNPLYGRVICRCETVTEGEIVDAIHSPIPPVSVDGVKRRVGAGMGRCQGGFCGPKVVEILSRELGIDKTQITKDRKGSYILTKPTKTKEENGNV